MKHEKIDDRLEFLDIVKAMALHIRLDVELGRNSSYICSKNKLIKDASANIDLPSLPLHHGRNNITLNIVEEELGDCRRCVLSETRNNIVFGEGNHNAKLVFVGEAPGADEDAQGRPFVGRAGQLLTKIIEAMGMHRNEVYICNILKCRPPANRNPKPDEIHSCEPFLIKQLQAINPDVICALGTFAAQSLLKTDAPITTLRGRFHKYQGIDLMPTYHPAYLLRNVGAKKQVWDDVKKIMDVLR